MAQISLHDYLNQIDTLLEENRLSEAIAHCRHILNKFPRYVDAYRLYGKALLEQQKFDDAVNIFQRVLSADPEDLISHVALAITHKEKEEVPEAIWHFERAFEMDPYNGTIQEELRGLYAHRDGLRPKRIQLTRGALARLYFRGNLYQQAAAELRQLLSKDEDRLDLQILLAETLWRDDQRVDVVDICLRILDKIPYCIKANAILAEVWLVTGRPDEALEYLQRLRLMTRPEKAHLEPDSVVGRAFTTNGIVDLPDEVLVEELDYFPESQELSGESEWVTEFGLEPELDEEASWLDEIEKVDASVFAEAADSDEDMLDWLREVAVSEGESLDDIEDGGETRLLEGLEGEWPDEDFEGSQDEAVDWLSEGADTSRESLADVPDWLSEVTASAEADMWNTAVEANEGQAETDEDEVGKQKQAGQKAQTPDWIRDLRQENEGEDPTVGWREEDEAESWMAEEEAPDWIEESDEIPDWVLGEGADADDFPDWLNESDETASGEEDSAEWSETKSEEDFPEISMAEPVYGVTGEEIPDWLRGSDEDTEAEEGLAVERSFEDVVEASAEENIEIDFEVEGGGEAVTQAAVESGDEDVPDWLADVEEMGLIEPEDVEVEGPPEWLAEETEIESEVEAPEETADWLQDFEEAEEAGGEFPDWLTEETEIESEVEAPGETADWLQDFEEIEEAGGELPDWLTEETEIESEVEAPEETADWLQDFEEVEEAGGEFPDWLTEETEIESEVEAPEETADWLQDFEEVEEAGGELPEWLAEETEIESEVEAPEETADWLQDFEEAEEAGDALPDWLEDSPDLIMGQTDIDQENLPDWLHGDNQEEVVREENLMGNSEEQENEVPDIPEDMDEAMKWLEELAAEQGADPAELPSIQEETPAAEGNAVEDDDVPDWLKADLSDGNMAAEDDLPDWLKNEATSMSGSDWMNLSSADDLSDMTILENEESKFEGPAQPSEDIPDWLKAQMPEEMQSEVGEVESDENLGWLDQIAAGEGAPIDELPTLSWDEDQQGGDLESADLTWLEGMAETESDSQEEEPEKLDIVSETTEDEVSVQVPDDPDEAMAWLEQLAAQQGTPLDELPTLVNEDPQAPVEVSLEDVIEADKSEAPEIDQDAATVFEMEDETEFESELDVPDDPDEAMAWLEQLAAKQGASLDELPTINEEETAEEVDGVSELESYEMPTVVDLPEEPASEADLDAADLDIPEDPDEAMAWLEQLAARQGASLEELPTIDVVPDIPTPVSGIAMEEEVDLDLEPEAESEPEVDLELETALADLSSVEMPEDDDEALAWLNALIAGDTAEVEEEPEPAFEAPEDILDQTLVEHTPVQEIESIEPEEGYPAEIEATEEAPVEAVDELEDILDQTVIESEPVQEIESIEPEEGYPAEIEATEEASLFEAIEDETDQFIEQEDDLPLDIDKELEDEELASTLPEWLQFEPMEETSQEELDWLDSFGESDVDSWLEAEEQVTQVDLPIPDDVVESEPVAFVEPEPAVETERVEEPEDYSETPLEEISVPSGPIDQSELESARSALEIGDYDTALEQYQSFVQSSQGLPLVIADLETAAAKHSDIALLQRLLGDAYMQNGQLQKAIDTYRQALDNL